MQESSSQVFDTPWEAPQVKMLIDMFSGTVTDIKSMSQIELQANIGGNTDGNEIHG